MQYVEITVEEAIRRCNKHAKILVAIQDLKKDDSDAVFFPKRKEECCDLFKDVQTVATAYDDLVRRLDLFTEKQDIFHILPVGMLKTVLLKE